ncbi:ElyC/SanA/YdcF family protein [Serinicoccus marinus]|uniref:ElyC/SanA/YdcF family protein n=1 Tax=Serinicoccus marinus TaxID=247333 RepID=UPI0003FFD3C1|nr:ElyC/SanA/YdcF family protein [Serinicoccus marinus]
MEGFGVSAVLAVLIGAMLLPVLLIPYVAWSYRRGTAGPGRAALAAAGVIYAMALWTYTIVPLPAPGELVCSGAAGVQLVPLRFLADIDWSSGLGVLTDRALLQVVLNVVLFVPLGAFLGHLARSGRAVTLVTGFLVSLGIELTQLTGIWWVYPCSFRVFDVDDLLANTTGAGLGLLLVPLLARVPGQQTREPAAPAPVRPPRRLLGMVLDVVAVVLLAGAVEVAVRAVVLSRGGEVGRLEPSLGVTVGIASAVMLLLVWPLLRDGSTPGQRAVLLRTIRPDGTGPRAHQVLIRFLVGSGGYLTLRAVADAVAGPVLEPLAQAWAVLSVVVVLAVHTRGVSGYAAGTLQADVRERTAQAPWSDPVDPRQLSSAVLAVGGTVYLGLMLFVAVAAVSPGVGLGIGLVLLALLAGASVLLAGYVLTLGVVVVRREGPSLGNGLALLAVAGVLALLAGVALAWWTGWPWLAVVSAAGVTVSGYLGFLFLAFLLYGQVYARRAVEPGVDAVVVLGSRIFGEHVPPLLRARIDRGVEVYDEQRSQGHTPVFVLSGGQGSDEPMPEAQAMAAYARERGVDPEAIREERASLSTEQNLTLSRELLDAEGREGPMVVATNNFHAFRAAIIARELDIRAQVVGAPTARFFFPSAVLREFVGVLSRRRLVHLGVVVALATLSGALAWLLTAAPLG